MRFIKRWKYTIIFTLVFIFIWVFGIGKLFDAIQCNDDGGTYVRTLISYKCIHEKGQW